MSLLVQGLVRKHGFPRHTVLTNYRRSHRPWHIQEEVDYSRYGEIL